MAKDLAERQARIESQMQQAGVPRGFRGRTLDNFVADTDERLRALKFATAFANRFPASLKNGASPVLLGGLGVGKTHLAIGCVQYVMSSGHTAMYMTAFEMVSRLRDTMRKDSEIGGSKLLDALGAVELLVIDEIGVQAPTDDAKMHVANVLDRRYMNGLPSMLLSNLCAEEFNAYLGDRIADRLCETGRFLELSGESYRSIARKQVKA